MLVHLRRDALNLTIPAVQLGLVVVALRIDNPRGTAAVFALVLAIALYCWLWAIRHARLIMDTPTSRIASAAQGYVELRGRGLPLAGMPVLSPLTGLPVLWYRLQTMRRHADGKWRHESTSESDASFLLEDDSGYCAIDPEGAEMLVNRSDVRRQGNLRQTQWCLLPNDPIYVLGEFATLGSISPEFDTATQVRDLLAHWKTDRPTLLRRFDLDGNGELDLAEWALARAEARREVERQRHAVAAAAEVHLVRAPSDTRLYLISDLAPDRVARRYRGWAAFHLAAFLAATAGCAWLLQVAGSA